MRAIRGGFDGARIAHRRVDASLINATATAESRV
jgi:hypothetical protein